MQRKFRWAKGFFSSLYKIYSNGEQIGSFKDKAFSQSAVGKLNNKEYLFKTKGFFNQKTQIIDASVNKAIGEIKYNNWMTKATITINNKTINWKYDNIWNTKWSVFDSEGINIKYSGSSTDGEIESNTDDDLLLLSGLFVTNYYWQITIGILVVVIIIIST